MPSKKSSSSRYKDLVRRKKSSVPKRVKKEKSHSSSRRRPSRYEDSDSDSSIDYQKERRRIRERRDKIRAMESRSSSKKKRVEKKEKKSERKHRSRRKRYESSESESESGSESGSELSGSGSESESDNEGGVKVNKIYPEKKSKKKEIVPEEEGEEEGGEEEEKSGAEPPTSPEGIDIKEEVKAADEEAIVKGSDVLEIVGKETRDITRGPFTRVGQGSGGDYGAAYSELYEQLCSRMVHRIMRFFYQLYAKVKDSNLFRKKLVEIQTWNQDQINRMARGFVRNHKDIIRVFRFAYAADVLVMSVVVQRDEHSIDVEVDCPKFSDFCHRCFIETARNLFDHPGILDPNLSAAEKMQVHDALYKSVCRAIASSLRMMVPIHKIAPVQEEEEEQFDFIEGTGPGDGLDLDDDELRELDDGIPANEKEEDMVPADLEKASKSSGSEDELDEEEGSDDDESGSESGSGSESESGSSGSGSESGSGLESGSEEDYDSEEEDLTFL